MKSQHTRTARIEARISPEALAVVRWTAAQVPAQKTVAEMEVIRLSREAQEQLVSLLLNPPQPSDALIRALKRRRELIVR